MAAGSRSKVKLGKGRPLRSICQNKDPRLPCGAERIKKDSSLFPGDRTRFSIIGGEKFKIEHIDDPIVIHISFRGSCFVVIHPNGQRIELIDEMVAIDIPGNQSDGW